MYAFIKGFAFPENKSKLSNFLLQYFSEALLAYFALLALQVSKTFLGLLAFVLACF